MGQIGPKEEMLCSGQVISGGQTDGMTVERTEIENDRLITFGCPQSGTLMKSSRLSQSFVVRFSSMSLCRKMSKYETDDANSVLPFFKFSSTHLIAT